MKPAARRRHDLFGRGGDDAMRTLKRLQHEARRVREAPVAIPRPEAGTASAVGLGGAVEAD